MELHDPARQANYNCVTNLPDLFLGGPLPKREVGEQPKGLGEVPVVV